MNWRFLKDKLASGETVQFRPRGNSMQPRIKSGQLVTVEPCQPEDIKPGDIVFCRVKGNHYVHLVQSIQRKMAGWRFQIGNMRNHTNGTVGENCIFGKVVRVET